MLSLNRLVNSNAKYIDFLSSSLLLHIIDLHNLFIPRCIKKFEGNVMFRLFKRVYIRVLIWFSVTTSALDIAE